MDRSLYNVRDLTLKPTTKKYKGCEFVDINLTDAEWEFVEVEPPLFLKK